MNLGIGTTARIAFYSTLIESIIGVIFCALYILFHFCAISVSCPGNGKLDQVAFTFYTTYIKAKDSCNVTNGSDKLPEIMSNTNDLTQPNIIFFWQILLLLLYLAWVGTALMLQQVEKKSRSAIPWLFVTFLVIVTDFAASAISLTDYKHDEMTTFSCTLDSEWSGPRKSWTTMLLFLFFSRGIFIWILNLWGFLTVTAYIIENGKKTVPSTPAVAAQANKNPVTDYWATPPGHTLNLEERDLPEMNTFSQDQPRSNDYPPPSHQPHVQSNHYQAPSKHYQSQSNHYQPPSNDYQPPTARRQETQVDKDGLRRPQSFVERIRNAENSDGSNVMPRDSQLWSYSNPGVRKELQSRGENIRPMQPDKDVDSAFNFLETYSIKEDGAEPPMEADSVKSYSKYLSSQQERQTESQGIPRVRIPASGSRVAPAENNRGPGSRYFVPLKN